MAQGPREHRFAAAVAGVAVPVPTRCRKSGMPAFPTACWDSHGDTPARGGVGRPGPAQRGISGGRCGSATGLGGSGVVDSIKLEEGLSFLQVSGTKVPLYQVGEVTEPPAATTTDADTETGEDTGETLAAGDDA